CSESGGKGRSSKVHARREGIVDRAARAYQKIFCSAGIFLSPSFGNPELTTSKQHEKFFERTHFFLVAWKTCQPRKNQIPEPNSKRQILCLIGSWNLVLGISFFVRLFQYSQEDLALVVGFEADAFVQIQRRLIAGIDGKGQLRRFGCASFPQRLAR